MSTPDPSALGPAPAEPALEISSVPAELRGSVLDPAVLGRIASEMFRAIPGGAPEISGVALPFAPASHPVSSVPSGPPRGLPPVGTLPLAGPSIGGPALGGPTHGAVPSSVPFSGAPSHGGPTASAPIAQPPSTAPLSVLPLRELSPLFGLDATMPSSATTPSPAPVAQGLPDPGLPYFMSETRASSATAPPLTGARPDASAAAPRAGLALDPELVPALSLPHRGVDVHAVRRDFPILSERVHGKPLVWLDNAATTQKPRQVIDRIAEFYERENSNIHRAAHTLAARATDAYEAARDKARRFLGAGSSKEIIFVRGTTEGMNLIAKSWGDRHVGAGDEIVLTTLEHHSNIVPWQMLAKSKGARLKVAPVDDTGQILLDDYERLFTSRTKLASITHVSNALGTVLPVKEMTEIAHRHGARVVIDGAQSVSHLPIDVQALGCDFFVFSGHKVFGPTGIGVVFGKSDVLEETPPWQGGGNMIVDVTFEKTVYAPVPGRFEAGTGNIADAVGLGAALDYVMEIGMHNIASHEHELLVHAQELLYRIPGLRPVGTAKEKASVVGFVLDGYEPLEVGVALDREGIAVRAGHHCAQPALRRFGLEASVRPSLALYNTRDEVEHLARTVERLASARHRGR